MLTNKLWSGSASYGERRGASYALAGLVRGLGLQTVKRMDLLEELLAAAQDKDARRRQGAFIAMETLAIMLGRLYEPYTVRALPIMLVAMGDSVVEVRDACWAAAQASMAEVSSQGVKMILPALLSGLKERQWRTKAGAAEVLGAMAYCAPRQLSLCLPLVVPQLADALADAGPKLVTVFVGGFTGSCWPYTRGTRRITGYRVCTCYRSRFTCTANPSAASRPSRSINGNEKTSSGNRWLHVQ
jgi:hypothetical protein